MEETYSTDAIVLDNQPWREHDSRIVVYSRQYGKLELIVRGTKKILSKLSGHIEPVTLGELMVVRGRQFDYVGGAVGKKTYPLIKGDILKIASAGVALKAFNKIVKPGVADDRLFFLLEEFLDYLENRKHNQSYAVFSYYFILKLLSELGFRPEMGRCVVCNKKITPANNRFSASQGGLVCGSCQGKDRGQGLTISENAIKILRLVNQKPFAELSKIETDARLEKEIMSMISYFYQYHF